MIWEFDPSPITAIDSESEGGDWAHHPKDQVELLNDLVKLMQLDYELRNFQPSYYQVQQAIATTKADDWTAFISQSYYSPC